MKKFSKVLVLGLAATMLSGSFAGCTKPEQKPAVVEPGAEEPAAPVEEVAVGPVTLKTVSMFGGTDPMAQIYADSVKAFMDANPTVTVEDSSATADDQWKSMILTDFAAGNEPDVIFFFTDVTAKQLVDEGKVVSIDEIRTAYPEYASNISAGAMTSAACPDGKQYAVPIRGYYEGIFCNKDLFDKYSLELPTTWENLEKAVTTFSKEGITPIGAALGHIPNYWIEHFILAQGGVADHANRDVTAVKETWVNGLANFKKFGEMGAFPKDAATTQHELMQQAFNDKKAAMFLDGNWAIGNMTDADNVVLVPMPAANDKKDPSEIIAGFSSGYFITKKAWDDPAKRDAAVKFIESLTTTDLIRGFVEKAGGGAPAADVGEMKLESKLGAQGAAMAGAAKNSDSAIDGWLPKPAWDYLMSKVPGLAAGKEDAAAVVDEVIKLSK